MRISAQSLAALRRPEPYEPGEPLWTHPHIAAEMLKAHLDPSTDAASYRPQTIERICAHLTEAMALKQGSHVVDLGCGPGLYCRRLAECGMRVTGIDQSENSLRYAQSQCEGYGATFRQASYLAPFGEDAFDAALMVSQDYGVLPPGARRALLANVHRALRGGGRFAMDVPTMETYQERAQEPATGWESAEGGFWRAEPYITLHALHLYPDIAAVCDLYAVLTEEIAVYRVWQTFFTEASLRREMEEAGFTVKAVWGDLTGQPCGAATLAMMVGKP